jgi:hypothetical protein
VRGGPERNSELAVTVERARGKHNRAISDYNPTYRYESGLHERLGDFALVERDHFREARYEDLSAAQLRDSVST